MKLLNGGLPGSWTIPGAEVHSYLGIVPFPVVVVYSGQCAPPRADVRGLPAAPLIAFPSLPAQARSLTVFSLPCRDLKFSLRHDDGDGREGIAFTDPTQINNFLGRPDSYYLSLNLVNFMERIWSGSNFAKLLRPDYEGLAANSPPETF
ncbi:hypothetical protein ACJJTC_005476 [Scirpophaga incertulas]